MVPAPGVPSVLKRPSATSIADHLNTAFALIHKERPRPNVVGRMVSVLWLQSQVRYLTACSQVLVGSVEDKVAILVGR